MITAVTVQNINGMDFIKIMLQGISTEYTGNTRIKTGSQKSSQSCFLKFLIISPLPGIIEICSKAFFFTSLFIDCTPCGIFCILCFIIGSINIIRTGFQTCIHDGKILIWKCHIQDSIRLIGSDQFCDLTRHQEASGKSLEYFDSETNEHYIPYVIEPSLGCDRVALAFLCEAYDEEHLTDSKGKEDVRTVLHLHPALAPYKCAVLPLSKKLGEKAMEIRNELSKYFMVDYDDTGSIGKRYRREDEIGTPYCITVDFDTVGDEAKGIVADNCVTIRDRDTMEQVRMPISELKSYIESKIEF